MRLWLAMRLALLDCLNERGMTLALGIALGAVLGPLLILDSLRGGTVARIIGELSADPAARELRVIGNRAYDLSFLEDLAARPEVGFVVGRTRSLAVTGFLEGRRETASPVVDVEMIPSAPGDPLLSAPLETGRIALSQDAADRLGLGPGAPVRLSVERMEDGLGRRAFIDLEVAEIVPRRNLQRPAVFVPLPALADFEAYRDGYSVAGRGWEGDGPAPPRAAYASFRIYAADIHALDRVASILADSGIETRSDLARVSFFLGLDATLRLLFAFVAGTALAGFVALLGLTLYAHVERKRRTLAILTMMGLPPRWLVAFPLTQALLIAAVGVLLGLALLAVAGLALDRFISGDVIPGGLRLGLALGSLAVTLAAILAIAGAAAGFPAWRASRIEPAEGWSRG